MEMKYSFVVSLIFITTVGFAKTVCTGETTDGWVKERRANIENSVLFKYGVTQFGEFTSCMAEIAQESDGNHFGTIAFNFKNSVKLTVENMPPETSIVKIESEKGFPNESEAIAKLKEVTAKAGLKIDWSKPPEIVKSKDIQIKKYWDPSPGINGQGFFNYNGKMLVGIGYSMAL